MVWIIGTEKKTYHEVTGTKIEIPHLATVLRPAENSFLFTSLGIGNGNLMHLSMMRYIGTGNGTREPCPGWYLETGNGTPYLSMMRALRTGSRTFIYPWRELLEPEPELSSVHEESAWDRKQNPSSVHGDDNARDRKRKPTSVHDESFCNRNRNSHLSMQRVLGTGNGTTHLITMIMLGTGNGTSHLSVMKLLGPETEPLIFPWWSSWDRKRNPSSVHDESSSLSSLWLLTGEEGWLGVGWLGAC